MMEVPGSYYATFEKFPETIIIRVPDFEEALSEASDLEAARTEAAKLLRSVIAFRADAGEEMPEATSTIGERIDVSASLRLKVMFIQRFREAGVSQSKFAQSIGTSQQEVNRMLNPWHNTKLDRLEAALAALGQRVVVTLEAAE